MSRSPIEEGTVELQPCPFCGDYDPEVAESSVPNIHGGHKHAVYCNACFCEGPTADSEAEAIAAWNRRASRASRVGAQGGEPVAWMHEFTEPMSGERVRVPQRIRPRDYEMSPGDIVRPLVYGDQPAPDSPTAAGPMTEEQKEAARYRWLRSIGHAQVGVFAHYAGPELDSRIDAAMGVGITSVGSVSTEGEVN